MGGGAVEVVEYSDKELVEAWAKLEAGGKLEAKEWFLAEVRGLRIFQNVLIEYGKRGLERDLYHWPGEEEAPVFDPVVHAPAQPIARVKVAVDSEKYRKEHERLVGWRPERRLQSAWRYDYARRTVVKVGDPLDAERIFLNGIRGFAPDLDLIEALCQMRLDDGRWVERHVAFGHLYALRTGACFPGITLYDAWSSGRKIEMPDVECLGILHTLRDDWKSFVAPVPGHRQAALYKQIEELYVPMHRARALQVALARAYLIASPALSDGYAGTENFLHLTWEESSSDPRALKEALPASEEWEKWMREGQQRLRKEEGALAKALGRREHLRFGESQVRRAWVRVLQGMGTLEAKGKAPSEER